MKRQVYGEVMQVLGPKFLLPMGCVKLDEKKLHLPAFSGWTNRKLITQFHEIYGK